MAGGASLETTPTWAVAVVCFVLIIIALFAEHSLHLLNAFLKRKKRKTLIRALHHIEAELRSFGFMSLALGVAQDPISKICISRKVANSLHPCKNIDDSDDSLENSCPEGRLPLLSSRGTYQLLLLIFMLAASHVLTSLFTFGLMMAKIKKWERWEDETQTLDYQLSTDPRRFKLARETSFGRRHLRFWRNHGKLLWIICFFRQLGNSVSKADYLALRHGFVMTHFPQDQTFDFRSFLRKSLDNDFSAVAGISPWSWTYAVLFLFFTADGFYSQFWLPVIPLMILLVVGTKLELAITKLCLRNCSEESVIRGAFWVKPNDNLFWFRKPRWLLHTIHFIMFQNAFQLAVFVWTWYKFGFPSCYHPKPEDIAVSLGVAALVQILCAYEILPLYALVSRVGSARPDTIFTDEVIKGLRRWKTTAQQSHAITGQNSTSSSPPTSPCCRMKMKMKKKKAEEETAASVSETTTDDGAQAAPQPSDSNRTARAPSRRDAHREFDGEASFFAWHPRRRMSLEEYASRRNSLEFPTLASTPASNDVNNPVP
ncbi:MLO-like protein 12 [Wolffia australiana]